MRYWFKSNNKQKIYRRKLLLTVDYSQMGRHSFLTRICKGSNPFIPSTKALVAQW